MKRRLKYWGRDYLIKELALFIDGATNREIAKASGVATKTIKKLRLPVSKGGTRFVKSITIRKILRCQGYDLGIIPLDID